MKNILIITIAAIIFFCSTNKLLAQNNIGIGTITPNPKALLDLQANDKGFLVPRVSSSERLAINPAGNTDAALLVYDTNDNLFYYWDGTQWIGFPQTGSGSNNIAFNFDANTNELTITDNGGSLSVNLTSLNNIYTAGTGIDITGNVITNTGDLSNTNELNSTLLFNNGTNILSLTDAGGTLTADLSSLNTVYTAGAGISIAGNVITNTGDLNNTNELITSVNFNNTNNILSITDAGGTYTADLSSLANDWKLLGNAGTNPTNNFLGTTDNQALVFRTNNTERARITNTGNVGIGTTTPTARLNVNGGNIHTTNNSWAGNQVFVYSAGVEHPYLMGLRGEGTQAAPTYPTSGKVLSSFIGRDVLDWNATPGYGGASMYMITTENFSATAKGTRLRFSTTPNGTNEEVERMTIQQNGFVGIGLQNPDAPLHVFTNSGAVGTPASRLARFTNSSFSWEVRVGGGNGWLAWVPDVASNRRWQINNENGTTVFNVNVGAPENSFFMAGTGHLELGLGAGTTRRINLPNIAANEGRGRAETWETYSDGRIKSDQQIIEYGLNEVLQLQPKSYNHHNSIFTENGINISETNTKRIGFIAQEVYKIIPEVVSKPENEITDLWSMSYEKLVPVLVKAIQEQQEVIEFLKTENKETKSALSEVKQLLIDTRLTAVK